MTKLATLAAALLLSTHPRSARCDFVHGGVRPSSCPTQTARPSSRKSKVDGVGEAASDTPKPEKKNSRIIVKFKAHKKVCTPPFELPPPGRALDDFFDSKENRNLLFSAGAVVQEVPDPTKKQMSRFWADSEAGRVGVQMAPRDDGAITRIVRLINPSMKFLGLKLTSIVMVGTQLLLGRKGNGDANQVRPHPGYPEFQFTLMGSSFKAEGPKATVWLFNKITGSGHDDESDDEGGVGDFDASGKEKYSRAIETSGFTRIWAEPTEEGKVIFWTDARLESRMGMHRVMLGLIPMSLEKLEKRGSATLQKAVEKDVLPAMKRFGDAYEEWLSSLQETAAATPGRFRQEESITSAGG